MTCTRELTEVKMTVLSAAETNKRITLASKALKRLNKAIHDLGSRSPRTRTITLFPRSDDQNVVFAAHSKYDEQRNRWLWRITMNLPMATLVYESNHDEDTAIEKAWRFAIVWCSSWIMGNMPVTTMVDYDEPIY